MSTGCSRILHELARRALTSHEVMVKLIAATTTQACLKIQASLYTNRYPNGIKVTGKRSRFHGDWNYSVLPCPPKTKI